jgi:hypothetical protein
MPLQGAIVFRTLDSTVEAWRFAIGRVFPYAVSRKIATT